MQYIFKLSGESPSIATAELRALFEIFNTKFKIIKTEKNLITLKTATIKKIILNVCARSAFIRKVHVGNLKIWEAQKGRFLEREPMKKPAFHPTMLKPKLARALVNLSRAKENTLLLDPFCGAGSILIEAAVLGAKVVGTDFDSEMIARAKKNLNFYKKSYKNKNYRLKVADATQLEKTFAANSIDTIATDLPYGRSSRASLKNLCELYEKFLDSANKVLKKKKYLALLYPNYIETKKSANKKQWKIISEGELYVHGGLTRKLLVFQKL